MDIQRCYACGNDWHRFSHRYAKENSFRHYHQHYRQGEPRYVTYHDTVWAVPVYDDKQLFAELMLRGIASFTPSLYFLENDSYETLLNVFDPDDISEYERSDVAALRGRFGHQRVESLMENVRCYFDVMENHGSFSALLWSVVDGQTIHNRQRNEKEIPIRSYKSDKMSNTLKEYGFRNVNNTACYAFMQAVGMVNDHLVDCFRYQELKSRYR